MKSTFGQTIQPSRGIWATAAVFAFAAGLLSACQSTFPGDTPGEVTKNLVQDVKGNLNPVPPVVTSELAGQDYPPVPNDRRPFIRSATEQQKLLKQLAADRAEGDQTKAYVEASDDPGNPIPVPASGGKVPASELPPPAFTLAPTPIPPPQAASNLPLPAVESVYQHRLAESAKPPPPKQAAATETPAADEDAMPDVALVSPSELHRRNAGAAFQPLEAFDSSVAHTSIRVEVIHFGEGTFEMSGGETGALDHVFRLFREKGGLIRVIGHSTSPRLDVNAKANRDSNIALARGRGEAVARELARRGVPAQRIYAGGAAVSGVDTAGEVAEIYIDY
jgi:outer membrane protein OmpA-like peptidoglycan-associated protein